MPPKFRLTGTTKYRKSTRRPPLPLLPGDAGLLRQIENQKEINRQQRMITEPLDCIGPLTDFTPATPQQRQELDIFSTIQSVIDRNWEPFPTKPNGNFQLSAKTMADCDRFRQSFPPLVSVSQLYGVFPASATKVDQAINQLVRKDEVKLLRVSSTDTSRDLVVRSRDFYAVCDQHCSELSALCRLKPESYWFDVSELHRANVDIKSAVSSGLLIIDPGNAGVHTLALPHQGRFLRLLAQARKWLLNTILQYNKKFKELPESMITDKLHASKRFWTQLYGLKLDWVLYDAVGNGYIDGFSTPIGRGWKVLRSL